MRREKKRERGVWSWRDTMMELGETQELASLPAKMESQVVLCSRRGTKHIVFSTVL